MGSILTSSSTVKSSLCERKEDSAPAKDLEAEYSFCSFRAPNAPNEDAALWSYKVLFLK